MLYCLVWIICYMIHRKDGALMTAGTAGQVRIDRWAIGLSGLCFVHCVASAVLITVLASAGSVLLDPLFHEIGMMVALVLGVIGLGRGVVTHGYMLPSAIGSLGLGVMAGSLFLGHEAGGTLYSVLGVMILALGHDLNRRAVL
jgi:hypothetical protein